MRSELWAAVGERKRTVAYQVVLSGPLSVGADSTVGANAFSAATAAGTIGTWRVRRLTEESGT